MVAFSSLAMILGEGSNIHCPPRLFFFFLKERLYIFHSLGQNQSMVAQHAETTVVKCSMRSRVSARFLIGSNAMPGQWHCQPTLTLMGQGCMQVKV